MSIPQVIKIVSWGIDKYENVKAWIKKLYRRARSKHIRSAVDKHDVGYIARILQQIKKRRSDRNDSAEIRAI